MNTDMLEYGISRYGTPLYIFDLDILERETKRIRNNFGRDINLCFAMKANPFVTEQMAKLTDRIEVCSKGEFEICRTLGIQPEKLLISGVLKKKEELFRILDEYGGRCAYTVESVRQFHYLAEWSDAHNEKLRLYLRLTGGDQFGMDAPTLKSVISLINMSPLLNIEGLHYFTGTRKKSLARLKKEINYVDEFLIDLKTETGMEIKNLEYGPGISVPYFEGEEPETYTDSGMQEFAAMLSGMRWKGKITVEMGRAFAASCGYYLTGISDVKTNKDKNYCIVDGGSHHLNYDGQIKGMYIPDIKILPEDPGGIKRQWNVCGALCTFNDVLISNALLTGVRTGKTLVFGKAGAYSAMEGMSLFLSHALPAVVSWKKDEGWLMLREKTDTYTMNMPQ